MPRFLHKIPAVRILIPFIAGIILQYFLSPWKANLEISESVIIGVLTLSVTVYIVFHFYLFRKAFYRLEKYYGWILMNLFFICGFTISFFYNRIPENHISHLNGKNVNVIAVVSEEPVHKSFGFQIILNAKSVLQNTDTVSVQGKIQINLLTTDSFCSLKYGDKIFISGLLQDIRPPEIRYRFDYRQYLGFLRIYSRMNVKPDDAQFRVLGTSSSFNIVAEILKVKERFISVLRRNISSKRELGVAEALLLGYRNDISSELQNHYITSGTMHVLSVSGLHVGVLYFLIFYLLFPLNVMRRSLFWKVLTTITFLIFYTILTGASPSVLRACVMFSVILIGKLQRGYTNIYNTLAVSALLILCFNPNLLFNVSFQLSYAALLGIVWLQPHFVKMFVIRVANRFLNPIFNWIWQITCVSVAAQIFTMPIGILYFHQFSTYFIFSNLMVIPLSSLALGGGLTIIISDFLSSTFSFYIGKILSIFLWLMNETVILTDKLPQASIHPIFFTNFQSVILYLLVIACGFYLFHRKRKLIWTILSLTFILSLSVAIPRIQTENKISLLGLRMNNDLALVLNRNYHNAVFIGSESQKESSKDLRNMVFPFLWANGVDTLNDFVQTNLPQNEKLVFKDFSFADAKGYLFLFPSKRGNSFALKIISPNKNALILNKVANKKFSALMEKYKDFFHSDEEIVQQKNFGERIKTFIVHL